MGASSHYSTTSGVASTSRGVTAPEDRRSDQTEWNAHRDRTCWGIWTDARDAGGSPANGVPVGQEGACLSEFGNLTGTGGVAASVTPPGQGPEQKSRGAG
jgi:hypothetical protein